MANRPKGYGMTSEVHNKIAAKYDTGLVQEVVTWIEAVTGANIGEGPDPLGAEALQENLKDGIILCKLINELQPDSVKKVNQSKMAFKLMENIGNFLSACESYGVAKTDMFQTVDLFEGQNMPAVVNGVHALGRKAQAKGYSGPTLGPKESAANKREFTEEQLKAGEGMIGLQMGSNKGASQAGQNFGKTRAIID